MEILFERLVLCLKKKIKDGSLYYHQKVILRPVGAGLLLAGLAILYFGWSYISYILSTIAIPVGLIMFIVGSSKHISDNDMQEQMDHAMLDYDTSVTGMSGFERVILKQPAPFEISAYSFGDDARYFKKGKNGTPVSDRYTRAHVFYTKDGLIIVGRTLSVATYNESTGEGITDFSEQLLFSGLTSASLECYETSVTLTNTGKTVPVKWCELVICGGEGELLRIPAKNDMDASSLVDDINRRCGK